MQKQIPVLFYEEGTCALGSLISLLWSGQPFKLCRLEEGDETHPDFLKLNALGEVPLLFLDGTVLTENVAVLQHIGQLDLSKGLSFMAHTAEFDQLNRALGFLTSSFHKSYYPIFAAADLHSDPKVQAEIKNNAVKGHLHDVWKHTNDHLLRTTLMFDHPTVPDAYLFAMARWGDELYNIEKEFPNVKRFQDAMNADPYVKFALAIESGKQTKAEGNFLGHLDFKSFVTEAAHRKLEVDRLHHDGDFTAGLIGEIPKSKPKPQQKHA